MAHHASFEHERLKLSDKSIRLFQVQRGRDNEPISLRMTQFSAQRQPTYKAVSYTWGSSQNPKQILVNGKAFHLHLNLWDLLYHLRQSGETSFIWADALCINQLNLRERNFHVQLMGRIYERAETVIVWLGVPTFERTEINAFNFVKDISRFRKAHSDTVFVNTYLKPAMRHRWETLFKMTDHFYWHRTWIIQEFLFAPDLEVFSGKHKLEWKEFESLIELMQTNPAFANHSLVQKILQSRTTRLTVRRMAGNKSNLHELLQEYSDSACTERRDKVYGILGLAADCLEDPDTGEVLGIKPDYNKHIVEVYLDALECIKLSLPTDAVVPAAVLLILRALHITSEDIASYILRLQDSSIPQHLANRTLSVTPEYVSSVLTVFTWTSLRDLQRQLELYDWGEHIGYEIQRLPSNSLQAPTNRSRRLSSRTIHSALPSDFISTALEAANLSTDLSLLHNYPSSHDLIVSTDHISMHSEDKRFFENPELQKPSLILEQNSESGKLRVGFACTNVQRGDLIVQFQGLDTTLIVRQTGHECVLVGKSMMLKNSEVLHETLIDPICDANIWASHSWSRSNPELLQLDTDPLSLAEMLLKG